ncbi:MAG TPA: HEAT repeat domain-containing protein [Longimicrobiales bacterium]|nr:HEAT repeat domain-containing protein [Longimicrobiales bacterium]
MTLPSGAGLGAAGLILAVAWAIGGEEPADLPPASADLPRLTTTVAGSTGGSARGQASDAGSLEEVLAAARGLDGLACELAARGVQQGIWFGGRRSHGRLTRPDASAATLEAGFRAARTQEGARVLIGSLLDEEGCPPRLALSLLDHAEPKGASALLRPILADTDPERRRRATLGIGAVDSEGDRVVLEELLNDGSPDVRIAATWALGEIEDAAAIPALTRVLADDADPRVRGAAAQALGEISG